MKFIITIYFLFSAYGLLGQTMQATIKNGNTPRTIDVYLKPSASFSQKDEALTLSIAIPATVSPGPSLGASGTTTNSLGPVSGITGLIPAFLVDNFEATQREVYVSKEKINGDDYYVYAFIFATTASQNHDWVGGVEQLIFSIQFNGCVSNCDPLNEMLVNLPNGGAEGRAYWYFQPNTLGDITNYPDPFYQNDNTTTPTNGGSTDGSALSWITLSTSVVLPVKLTSFNVEQNDCNANLSWVSDFEQDLAYYSIERSDDGAHFSSIGKVIPSKDESSEKRYSFMDKTPVNDISYYRLKMVDNDGQESYSKIVSVKDNCKALRAFSVIPTVSTGLFTIRLAENYENAEVSVLNSYGQTLFKNVSGSSNRLLNLSNQPNGIYLVRVTLGERNIGSQKIMLGH